MTASTLTRVAGHKGAAKQHATRPAASSSHHGEPRDVVVRSPYRIGSAGAHERLSRGEMKTLYATPGAAHPIHHGGMATFRNALAATAGGVVVATALAMGSGLAAPAPPPPISMSTVVAPSIPTAAASTRVAPSDSVAIPAPTTSTVEPQNVQKTVLPPGPWLGTTYTNGVAQSAGMTDAQAFQMMHEMGITTVRLGTYWNQIQPNGPNDANFTQLDQQLSLAHKYGMKVVLTVGMKSPGWPEGYIPSWAQPQNLRRDPPGLLQKVDSWLASHWAWYARNRFDVSRGTNLAQDPALRQHALNYEQMVVRHVAGDRDIVAFQVENEPGVEFGPVKDYVGSDFVLQEAHAIQDADPAKRALALNLGLPMNAEQKKLALDPTFKVIGLDVYPEPGTHVLGMNRPDTIGEEERMVDDPTQTRQMLQKAGKEVYIAEMQAEPWNPVPWNAQKSMDNFNAQRGNGFNHIMPWNLGFVLRQYAKGDKTEFNAWQQMSQDLHKGTPVPHQSEGAPWNRAATDWQQWQEFWSGQDKSGHLK